MVLLDREGILKADDLPSEDVEVPEWGGVVRVRTMTGAERDEFEATVYSPDADGKKIKVDRSNFRAKLLCGCIVDDDGNRMFSLQDITVLGAKSAKALQRVFDVAQALNGLSEEAQAEIEKNSEGEG